MAINNVQHPNIPTYMFLGHAVEVVSLTPGMPQPKRLGLPLIARIKEMGIENHVDIIGHVPLVNMPEYYRSADCYERLTTDISCAACN